MELTVGRANTDSFEVLGRREKVLNQVWNNNCHVLKKSKKKKEVQQTVSRSLLSARVKTPNKWSFLKKILKPDRDIRYIMIERPEFDITTHLHWLNY